MSRKIANDKIKIFTILILSFAFCRFFFVGYHLSQTSALFYESWIEVLEANLEIQITCIALQLKYVRCKCHIPVGITSHRCLLSVYFQHKLHLNYSQKMFLSPVQCTLNTKFHVFMMKDKIVAECWWQLGWTRRFTQ